MTALYPATVARRPKGAISKPAMMAGSPNAK
jgi:hypothetical protein